MRLLNQLSISIRLFIFLLLPLITLLFFAGVTVFEKRQKLEYTHNALHFVYISQQLSAVVYQLQKERGLTAGAIVNRGSAYQTMLVQQRLQTDAEIKKLIPLITNTPSYITADITNKLGYLNDEFNQLLIARIEIDNKSTNEGYFDLYSHIITEMLNIISFSQQISIESNQKDLSSSYLNSLWLEEYSGQERDALNDVFAINKFDANQFSSISSYISGQRATLRAFYNIARAEHHDQLRKALDNSLTNEVKHYREIILNSVQRNDALNGIHTLIGYGGLIHDFKNYVIRGDSKYAERCEQQLSEASRKIEAYRLLPNISVQEQNALTIIQKTLQEYRDHIPTITKIKSALVSVNQIDQLVNVDDGPALNAINLLRNSITSSHNPDHWWDIATQRLDSIHQISTSIANDLILITQQNEQQMQQVLYLYLSITIVIILVSSFIAFELRSRLVNEIKYIARTMRSSQETKQFNQLLRVTGNDEIADMTNAFNNLITERTKAEESLKLAAQVFTSAHEGIVITDNEGTIVDVNPGFCRVTGYSRDEVIGKNPRILNSGRQSPEFYKEMWENISSYGFWSGEIWNRKKNGQIYPQILSISSIKSEKVSLTNYIAVTQNLEEQKKLEAQAHYDGLTKLPNRILLADRFIQVHAHSVRNKTLFAVCFLDLDKFKSVNDAYGHEAGDKLLIEVAERIKVIIREEDTVSRLGGDEFVLLLGNLQSATQCEQMLSRLIDSLSQPYHIDKKSIIISASIGVSLYPTDDNDFDGLMKHADEAMYEAKEAGRNCYRIFNIDNIAFLVSSG